MNPSRHTAYEIDGQRVASVSRVLKANGFGPPRGIPSHILQNAAERGKDVHAWCDGINRLQIGVADSAPDHISGYIEGYRKFLRDTRFRWETGETVVKNSIYRYAGRLDMVGTQQRARWVYDLKTAVKESPEWRLQSAAYALCLTEARKLRRGVVHLKQRADAKRPGCFIGSYKAIAYTDDCDFDDWLACVRVHAFKERHGILEV